MWQGTSFAAGLATGEIAARLPVNGDARVVRETAPGPRTTTVS